ncbi:MAG TPA: hypothetical protein VG935_01145 [Patescibacteria group bacterium]|nr:hypothetical protein [Patescibacteria group bacterium]
MHEVLPGIGSQEKDWPALEKKLELVKPFAKAVHVDIVDGKFAANTTFLDPKPFAKYSQDIFLELHMMVEEPEDYLEEWAKAGFRRFLGHIEKMSDQASFIAHAERLGEVGLAIDGATSLEAVKVDYQDLDTVLIMTINAGFAGQKFMPEKLDKVKKLVEVADFVPIEVDGGVNDVTLLEGRKAGATRFVTTSYLFGASDPQVAYQTLLKVEE